MLARGVGGGCVTALLGVATVLLAGILVSIDLGAEQSRAIGRLAGLLLFPIVALSGIAGVAWGWRPRVGMLASVAILVFATLPGVLPLWASSSTAQDDEHRALTDAERAPLVVEERGDRRVLTQRAVGFEMLEPVGLAQDDDPAIAAQLEANLPPGAQVIAWSWATPTRDHLLFVVLSFVAPRGSPEADAAYFEGTVTGATDELGAFGLSASDVRAERRAPLDHVFRGDDGAGLETIMRTFLYRHGESLISVSISAVGAGVFELEPVVLSAYGSE